MNDLLSCYECGVQVHELSPRSRCCMCEYGRAKFNERRVDQLEEWVAGIADDHPQIPEWIQQSARSLLAQESE